MGARRGEAPVRAITDGELRLNSSEVLRAVQAGEIIEVTLHGSVAAILVPPSHTPYERLVVAGKVRQTGTAMWTCGASRARRWARPRRGSSPTCGEIVDYLRR